MLLCMPGSSTSRQPTVTSSNLYQLHKTFQQVFPLQLSRKQKNGMFWKVLWIFLYNVGLRKKLINASFKRTCTSVGTPEIWVYFLLTSLSYWLWDYPIESREQFSRNSSFFFHSFFLSSLLCNSSLDVSQCAQ